MSNSASTAHAATRTWIQPAAHPHRLAGRWLAGQRHALTIFLSAALLFQVQPLMARCILPWFGGTPAVWTTCMLFFQTVLVGGYLYAHALARWVPGRMQFVLHATLLASTMAWLPILPDAALRPDGTGHPTGQILWLLCQTVGPPYLLLSATAPLVQNWFAAAFPQRSPYRLYALSNAGSLLGLFAYPFVVEPLLPLATQTGLWSAGYVVFAVICGVCAADAWRRASHQPMAPAGVSVPAEERGSQAAAGSPIALWLALSACGSVLLLATGNKMCQDVASVPFLWVLPLSIYLLSFIVVFARESWYDRRAGAVALLLAVLAVSLTGTQRLSLPVEITLYAGVLAVGCLVCHGELARLKPVPQRLTLYYLVTSGGGAFGGALVSLAAPAVFAGYYEFTAGLVATASLLAWAWHVAPQGAASPQTRATAPLRRFLWAIGAGLAAFTLLGGWTWLASQRQSAVLAQRRNFYGASRVVVLDAEHPQFARRTLTHGNTSHGQQFLSAELRETPTMYYARDTGVGQAIAQHPRRLRGETLRIGVVGLGAGTLCCYAQAGDAVRFYEIDPLVVELSQRYFTFQADARRRGAVVETVLGDARIVLERELAAGHAQQFDVLVIDAFSSDAIPLHLLTTEAGHVYRGHLADGGVLAFHISNRHLDLAPVIRALADDLRLTALRMKRSARRDLLAHGDDLATGSDWVVLTAGDAPALTEPANAVNHTGWPHERRLRLTDDHGSLFQLLKW